jgi:hypothetical protein
VPLTADTMPDMVETVIAEWRARAGGRAPESSITHVERESARDSLVTALRGPAPCDTCDRAPKCAARGLACSAFAQFVDGRSEVRWAQAPRTDASADRFAAIFAGDRRAVDRGGRRRTAA